MKKILIIHGPNLNLLGTRETNVYGKLTLSQVNSKIRTHLSKNHIQGRFFQSNGEGAIIDYLHKNRHWAQGIVINPAAYTHYSYAIRDAIASIEIPTVEVHLSDINKREAFRRKSVIKPVCIKQIGGHGWRSYCMGIDYLLSR